ncbi:hypothetical protein PIB30_081149 [Stylosanthes scabra]|uniref:Uncharacterized protein n=1 Tax=Stylosanthes scabra TaxID=79078 RepID=A0ABU6VU91_9FABA|nr:hypothetical protein [Stylosanthes scabra]
MEGLGTGTETLITFFPQIPSYNLLNSKFIPSKLTLHPSHHHNSSSPPSCRSVFPSPNLIAGEPYHGAPRYSTHQRCGVSRSGRAARSGDPQLCLRLLIHRHPHPLIPFPVLSRAIRLGKVVVLTEDSLFLILSRAKRNSSPFEHEC